MTTLPDIITTLQQTWKDLGGESLVLFQQADSPDAPDGRAIPLDYDGLTRGWLTISGSPEDPTLADELLKSWGDLLGKVLGMEQLAESLSSELIVSWNRLNFLHQMAVLMRVTTDPREVSLQSLRLILNIVEAENGFIAQQIGNEFQIECLKTENCTQTDLYIITEVLSNLDGIINRTGKEACQATFPGIAPQITSFMGQHLRVTTGTPSFIGLINQRNGSFTSGDIQLFESLAEQITTVIDTEALHQQQIRTEQINRELELAAEVQSSFLPDEHPDIPGYDLAARLVSASQIGGDFYDVFPYGAGETGILICDIAGKGISAALLAATMRIGLRTELLAGSSSPGTALNKTNTMLYEEMSRVERFATAMVLSLPGGKEMPFYASAGHTTAFWFQQENWLIKDLPSTSLPLGVLESIDETSLPVDMKPGDVLLLYSDGLTEVEDEQGKLFGMSGATDVLRAVHPASAQFIVESLVQATNRHRGDAPVVDDLTVVVIKKELAEEEEPLYIARLTLPNELSVLADLETEMGKCMVHLKGLTPEDKWVMEVLLALTEAVSNIVKHGGALDEIQGLIQVYDDRLVIDLYESGVPYVPTDLPPLDPAQLREGGYGLHIIEQVMDKVVYRHFPDGYNFRRMTRYLPGNQHRQPST